MVWNDVVGAGGSTKSALTSRMLSLVKFTTGSLNDAQYGSVWFVTGRIVRVVMDTYGAYWSTGAAATRSTRT